jgi:hypothetical protein
MATIIPGTCRYCGCTDPNACRLAGGEPCGWIDSTRTVCSSPPCVLAYQAAQARAREAFRQATRKLTPAEVHERIRNRGRKPKKGRAA